MTMTNQRGSAIVIVLLVIGIISIAGVGLLIQSRLDTKFTSSLRSYDKVFNLADGGAYLAASDLANVETGAIGVSGGGSTKTVYDIEEQGIGKLTATVAIRGYNTDPMDVPGWEIGAADGFHTQHWVATGTGGTDSGAGAQAVVQIAKIRISRN